MKRWRFYQEDLDDINLREEAPMKVKEYELMVEAVEAGLAYALNRLVKHEEDPVFANKLDDKRQHVLDTCTDCIMTSICERFIFPTEDT